MYRTLALVLCCAAMAQTPRQNPPIQGPIELAIQEYFRTHSEGRFEEAARARERARLLLAQYPLDVNQSLTLYQLYENSGYSATAREILQSALDRSQTLGESDPMRIQLYRAMAESWHSDRNLLKSVGYWERVARAMETAPSPGPNTARSFDGCCFGRGYANTHDIE